MKEQLKMDMPKSTYDRWVNDVDFNHYNNGIFYLASPTSEIQAWMENRMSATIKRFLSGVMGRNVDVKFVLVES